MESNNKRRKVVCIYTGCNKSMHEEEMNKHELNCEYKTSNCIHCKKEYLLSQLQIHQNSCFKKLNSCSNCFTKDTCIASLSNENQFMKTQLTEIDKQNQNKIKELEEKIKSLNKTITEKEQIITSLLDNKNRDNITSAKKNQEVTPLNNIPYYTLTSGRRRQIIQQK